MMKTIFPYTRTVKMADVLSGNRMLSVLERLHFRLGFGDASVAEVCRRNDFPTALFIEVSNVYMSADYEPDLSALEETDISIIADYIKSSHRYYAEVSVPHLHRLIHEMLDGVGTSFAAALNKFFDELVEKLNLHFEYEEKMVDGICASGRHPAPEEPHSQFIEKLDDLKNIVIKYLPDSGDNATRYNMLNHLLAMEDDMRSHIRVEDKIFNPLVCALRDDGDGDGGCVSDGSEVLSSREKEILAAVAHGKTNKEIADDLFISINTVVTHRKNIARKTGINSIAGLTVYAIINHIVEITEL